jgi:hypothetical protein
MTQMVSLRRDDGVVALIITVGRAGVKLRPAPT